MSEAHAAAHDHRLDTERRIDDFVASVRLLAESNPDVRQHYAVDGHVPSTVTVAASLEQVQGVLREASRCGLAVIPWGSGGQMSSGNTPARYDVALDLRGLAGTIEHEPADLTVTVDAGVTLAALEERLAAHAQFLPLDAPASATIGGVIATNVQGPLRHRFGTARDWLIGIEVVQADGTLVKSGGRVVKNVAGYDMTKLYIGSLGTLGVIVRATFKVAPTPAADRTLAYACASPHAAALILLSAHDAGLSLYASELMSPMAAAAVGGDDRWTALVRVAGGGAAVERSVSELRELAVAVSASEREFDTSRAWTGWSAVLAPRGLAMRGSVLPSQAPDVTDAFAAALTEFNPSISATPSAGVIRVRLDIEDASHARTAYERAREIVDAHGGSMVIDAAPLRLKDTVDVFGPVRDDFEIMRRLKEGLDPQGTLAPGRFVGRL